MSKFNVTVEEFTTPDPITAVEKTSISEMIELMSTHGIRHLPIMRDQNIVGIVSDRDVRLISGLNEVQKMQITAEDIMTRDPLTVSSNTALDEVAYLMSENKVGSVLVYDPKSSFLGIFTASDALNALVEIIRGE